MITCEQCRELIEQYIEGVISDTQLDELKAHAETCDACREGFERFNLMQNAIREAFSSETSAAEARETLLGRISEQAVRHVREIGAGQSRVGWGRIAVAASILLVVGLAIGFAVGRADSSKRGVALAAEVPIQVGNLEGTVLVRHAGMDVWDILKPGSVIRLGDKFHSTARSGFALELDDKSTIELNQNSMLVLKSYNGETQFFLEHGECTASLESPHGPFFIDTPNGRVEALGTEFTVTVE
ncbi:MAG TPA: FecR domain-containing protein [Sedimentisphaerales bacterium]|nr:FecR domain-containing protein [Sedimentisphaerales bacterium]